MRRWWAGILMVAVVVGLALLWWLWPIDSSNSIELSSAPAASANEGALPVALKQSSWNAPIQQRGERRLTGLVLRDGRAVAGAVVTGVAAHGEDVLSDLPCKCDNHCGQMLLACGCAEAAGQLVELVGARTGEGAPLARATSDAEGAFTLTGLEDGTLTLFADAPDGVGWLANVASDAQDAKVLLAEGRTIAGKVLTSDGKPAQGALVTAIFAEHSRFFDAVADAQGNFRLGPLPLGTYAVVAMQGGLLPDHKQVREDDTEALTLELSVPRSLSGVVLAEGVPLPGATVKLEGMHRKRTITTDLKGEFRVERLRPGAYELSAESSRGLGLASTVISKHEDRSGVTITITPGEPLAGRVVSAGAAAVPGAQVSLQVGDKWRSTQSDLQGAFRFEGVGAEEHALYAKKKGLLDAHGKGRGGQSGVELNMAPAAVLSGLVRSSAGELVLKYSISATSTDGGTQRQQSVTEASVDGGFELAVWPGEYDLRVEAPPLAPARLKVWAPASGLVLVMKPGAKIRGLVLNFDGLPAAGVRVTAIRVPPVSGSEGDATNAAGRFELSGLEAGAWVVTATMREEYMMTWRASGNVTLEEAGTAELVLRPKEGARFAGVVLSAEGEPVSGARVMGWQSSADGGVEPDGMGSALSDAEGRFRLHSLHAGPVQLMASVEEDHLRGHLVSAAPDENVVLKLSAGTTVSGRVVTSNGSPLTAFSILHEPIDSEDGRFTTPISERATTVAVDAEGYAQLMRKVQLKPGDNPLGDLVMQRGRPVSGVVRDARTHLPIAGALIDVGLEATDDFALSEELGAAKSDAQGRYRLPAVDSSSTFIFVTASRYVGASRPLTGNSADFELQPASALSVKVVDAAGAPVTRVWVVAQGARTVPLQFTAGAFQSKDLAAGSWRVSAHTADARTFRSVAVTLGEAPTELVLREATDGVTVEVKLNQGSESAVLIQGTVAVKNMRDLMRNSDSIRVVNGVAQHVLPGPYTVVVVRSGPPMEVAVQPIEVKASSNPVWTISARWEPFEAQ